MNTNFKFQSKITKEEMAIMPHRKFSGEIFYIDSLAAIDEFLPELNNENILGFDTETRPSFKKGQNHQIALMQLSTAHQAFLFRLNKTGLTSSLTDILTN